jgi:putative addiction module killer protein
MLETVELNEFTSWLAKLRDKQARSRIVSRITRLKHGHFGDSKSVGDGVFELRFVFGPGYRVYFANQNDKVVLLLAGGDKSTQARDIFRARSLLKAWKVQENGTA